MSHTVEILDAGWDTHNVRRLKVAKPEGYKFTPGQATDVAIDKDKWREEQRPFTFTSLNEWPELEFHIKVYPDHDGVTEQIGKLEAGDRLIIEDAWGAIEYKGPGSFIAGGAGVTPFIAILRELNDKGQLAGNRLIFSNSKARDIILRDEFTAMDGLDCLFTCTDEAAQGLENARIDRAFLEKHVDDFSQHFYVCGPEKMVEDISAALKDLGAKPDGIVFEE